MYKTSEMSNFKQHQQQFGFKLDERKHVQPNYKSAYHLVYKPLGYMNLFRTKKKQSEYV